MYVGRIVAIGKTMEGKNAAVYRVSSRSFPNRTAIKSAGGLTVSIAPRDPEEILKNPYIAYNCAKVVGEYLVISNGTHTDPISEKLKKKTAPYDALARTLEEMGYEKDDYNTPRIAGIIPHKGDTGWLGIVRAEGLEVKEIPLPLGKLCYIATYEHNTITENQLISLPHIIAQDITKSAVEGGEWAVFENPVTAVAGVAVNTSFETATFDKTTGPEKGT